jgi:hypothetical protein
MSVIAAGEAQSIRLGLIGDPAVGKTTYIRHIAGDAACFHLLGGKGFFAEKLVATNRGKFLLRLIELPTSADIEAHKLDACLFFAAIPASETFKSLEAVISKQRQLLQGRWAVCGTKDDISARASDSDVEMHNAQRLAAQHWARKHAAPLSIVSSLCAGNTAAPLAHILRMVTADLDLKITRITGAVPREAWPDVAQETLDEEAKTGSDA